MKKKIISAAALLLMILLLAVPALAEGSGDGSGGGSDDPLALSSSSLADGAKDVACDAAITLTFNKNVVNLAVKDSNLKCFSLSDAKGAVPVSVLMGDDQVDPNVKRIVTVRPKSALTPGTPYTLTISGSLTAKSGAALGSDIRLTFTTAGEAAASPTAAPPSPSASAKPSPAQSAAPTPAPSPQASQDTPAQPPSASPAAEAPASAAAASTAPSSAGTPSPSASDPVSPSSGSAGTPSGAGQGIILWLITGGTTVLLAIALFVVSRVKKRK